jgi:CHASE2 domain-containing sensor protein
LEDAATGNGFLNQSVDWDHVVRRVPLVLRLGDKPYPSLAAETLRLALGARSYLGRAVGANNERSFGEKTGLTAIRIGELAIPTDPAGRVWLHYAVPRRDRFVPAADVLAGNFNPALFADHIVLVGTSAAGVVNDIQATPIAPDVPGVEIHALLGDPAGASRSARLGGRAELLFALLVGIALISACRASAPWRARCLAPCVGGSRSGRRGSPSGTPAADRPGLSVGGDYPRLPRPVHCSYLRTEAQQREIEISRTTCRPTLSPSSPPSKKLKLGGGRAP